MVAEVEKRHPADQGDQFVDPFARHAVGEYERLARTHQLGIAPHHFEISTDIGGQIGLVDDQNIGLGYPRSVLAWNLVACGHVDHVDEKVHQRGAEGEGEVVAARFDQHHVAVGESGLHLLDRRNIHRRVFPHGRMRARAGFNADDPLLDKDALQHFTHVFGVFRGYHVVGYHQHFVAHVQKPRGDRFDECRFAGAYGTADSDSASCIFVHNLFVYSVIPLLGRINS